MLTKAQEKELNILLIEDNPDDVLLTKLASKDVGINGKFEVVNNGKSAIEHLTNIISMGKTFPDLILLDINLPVVNGFEVLKLIKSNQSAGSIPTVVFTSSDSISDMKYSYEHGADLFVRKPNNINDFKEVMKYIKNQCFKI